MFADLPLKAFNDRLASKSPTPGGGTVAALHVATAASLIAMVAELSLSSNREGGRKGPPSHTPDHLTLRECTEQALQLRNSAFDHMDRDAQAYDAVMASYKLPKSTEVQATLRRQAIQTGLQQASDIPLAVAKSALYLMQMAAFLISKGNQNALSDSKVALLTAHAALRGALYNVEINLIAIHDHTYCNTMKAHVARLTAEAEQIQSIIF